MLKEFLKKYLDAFFKVFEDDLKSLPKVAYDEDNEDNPSNLYVGEMDNEGWIQWQYVPVDRIIDFSELEEEYAMHISTELKEYYNSFYFLELCGFFDNVLIMLDKIDDTTDAIEEFRCVIDSNESMIPIGMDGRNCMICVKLDSGCVIVDDWECEEQYILADSLSEFFSKLKPRKDCEE